MNKVRKLAINTIIACILLLAMVLAVSCSSKPELPAEEPTVEVEISDETPAEEVSETPTEEAVEPQAPQSPEVTIEYKEYVPEWNSSEELEGNSFGLLSEETTDTISFADGKAHFEMLNLMGGYDQMSCIYAYKDDTLYVKIPGHLVVWVFDRDGDTFVLRKGITGNIVQ